MIKADGKKVQMAGKPIELIGELRGIGLAARNMFADDFGRESADKIVDAIFSTDSDSDVAGRIIDIIKEDHEEEKPVTSGNSALDLLIEALFGRGDK